MSQDPIEHLGRALPELGDLRGEYETYCKDQPDISLDAFLSHLVKTDRIQPRQFLHAHALSPVEGDDEHGQETGTVAALSEGTTRYPELDAIGRGGLAEVRLARDRRLLRKVAVKHLLPKVTNYDLVRRFVREGRITAQLDHPNIVPVYDFDRAPDDEAGLALVMKLVDGRGLNEVVAVLRERLRAEPTAEPEPDLRTRLGWFVKVCEAMSYAHSRGIVHRDLKPGNVMIGRFGEVYVMDWGVAKALGRPLGAGATGEPDDPSPGDARPTERPTFDPIALDEEATQHGVLVGTFAYMPPEQAFGTDYPVDHRADIFSLGLVLFSLVTLARPRPAQTQEGMYAHAEAGFVAPVEHVVEGRSIAPELVAIIRKATAQVPQDRYRDVEALAADVERFLAGEATSVLPDDARRAAWRWVNRHRQLALFAVVLAVLLSGAGAAIWGLARENAAIEAADEREERLTALLGDVTAQAHRIDSHFLQLEDLTLGLARSSAYLLGQAPPNQERVWRLREFKEEGAGPPDLAFSELYGRSVSVDYPVAKVAPGVRWEDVEPLLARLAPLRHHYRRTLLDSGAPGVSAESAEAEALLRERGLPIRWAYVGLEAGAMFSFPGKGTYPPDYDPRVRPWYRLGKEADGVVWGNPYLDLQGQGPVLPGVTPLRNGAGKLLGVLGVEVTYTDLIRELLRGPAGGGPARGGPAGGAPAGGAPTGGAPTGGAPARSCLLDEAGRSVVCSSELGDDRLRDWRDLSDPSLHLEAFDVAEVVASTAGGSSGLVEVAGRGDAGRLYVFAPVRSLGWTYVEEWGAEAR